MQSSFKPQRFYTSVGRCQILLTQYKSSKERLCSTAVLLLAGSFLATMQEDLKMYTTFFLVCSAEMGRLDFCRLCPEDIISRDIFLLNITGYFTERLCRFLAFSAQCVHQSNNISHIIHYTIKLTGPILLHGINYSFSIPFSVLFCTLSQSVQGSVNRAGMKNATDK